MWRRRLWGGLTDCSVRSGELRGFGRKPSWSVWSSTNIGLDGVITTSELEWGWLVSGLELRTWEEGWGAQVPLCGSCDQTLWSDAVIRRFDQTLLSDVDDKTLWSHVVIRRCYQTLWSDVNRRSYRRSDQTLWSDALTKTVAHCYTVSRTIFQFIHNFCLSSTTVCLSARPLFETR
jgi:hypothetical protein